MSRAEGESEGDSKAAVWWDEVRPDVERNLESERKAASAAAIPSVESLKRQLKQANARLENIENYLSDEIYPYLNATTALFKAVRAIMWGIIIVVLAVTAIVVVANS